MAIPVINKDVKVLFENGEVFNKAMTQIINVAMVHDLMKQEENVSFEKLFWSHFLTQTHSPLLTGTELTKVLQHDPVWDETKHAKCQILTAPLGFLFSDSWAGLLTSFAIRS